MFTTHKFAPPLAVGRKLRIGDIVLAGDKLFWSHQFEIKEHKTVAAHEKNGTSVRGPVIILRLDTAQARGLNRLLAFRLHHGPENLGIDQNFPFAAARIHGPEFGNASGSRAILEVRKSFSARGPFDPARGLAA